MKKAESTDSPHEAEACFLAAQRLATLGSIDLSLAQNKLREAASDTAAELVQEVIEIGTPGKKGLKTYAALFVVIADANEVKCDVLANYSLVYAFGYRNDIQSTKLLYNYLAPYMVRQGEIFLTTEATRGKRVAAKISRRISFQMGFVGKIGIRLRETQQRAVKEILTSKKDSQTTSLVLQEKQVAVEKYYAKQTKARGSINISKNINYQRKAFLAGEQAAKRVSLTPPNSRINKLKAILK